MKTIIKTLILASVLLFISCEQSNSSSTNIVKKGMIKVTILYPNSEGKTFDMDYYTNKHMPMVARLLGDSLKVYKLIRDFLVGLQMNQNRI